MSTSPTIRQDLESCLQMLDKLIAAGTRYYETNPGAAREICRDTAGMLRSALVDLSYVQGRIGIDS